MGEGSSGSRASIEGAGTIPEPRYRSSLTCGPAPTSPTDSRNVPLRDLGRRSKVRLQIGLVDHLISASEQGGRHVKAERFMPFPESP
jgi:hypothetical protein